MAHTRRPHSVDEHAVIQSESRPVFSVPFNSRTCIELATGARFYITYLNNDAVAREFVHRGWTVKKTTRQLVDEANANKEALLVVRKDGFYAHRAAPISVACK
jgi:hypothetical protein